MCIKYGSELLIAIQKDFETFQDLKFTNWNNEEPNDYGDGEDYAILEKNGFWNDYPHSAWGNTRILCELLTVY